MKWRSENGLHFAELAGHKLIVSEHGRGYPRQVDFYRWGILWRHRFVQFCYRAPTLDAAKYEAELAARVHLDTISKKPHGP